MSYGISLPVNQVRLTNVAVVRMNRNGKRFEVACYRNKIVNYRQGIETDLSEVLQTDRIFTNVSKGEFAKASDLKKAFGTADEEAVCRAILEKGQVQVSDMERSAQFESTLREVAAMVSTKCVDPGSNRPYTAAQIRNAMKECGFMVHPTRGVKQQFLDCVRLLRERDVISIERAKMELRANTVSAADGGGGESLVERLREAGVRDFPTSADAAGSGSGSGSGGLVFLIDPSLYRAVDNIVKDAGGRLEILRQCVTEEGDVNLDAELERKHRQRRGNGGRPTITAARGRDDGSSSDDGNDDAVVSAMSSRLRTAARISDNDEGIPSETGGGGRGGGGRDDEDPDLSLPPVDNMRKQQKKAQKKSKKAKRREKEEAAERQVRVEKEKARREERAARLGGGGEGEDTAADAGDATTTGVVAAGTSSAGDASGKSCNTCGGSFTPSEYRAHFRSDWHRYNMKLKLVGRAAVSEREVECDAESFFVS